MADRTQGLVLVVFSEDSDGKRYQIGTLEASDEANVVEIDAVLQGFWEEWKETWDDPGDPPRYSEFCGWVAENKDGFTKCRSLAWTKRKPPRRGKSICLFA